MPRRIQYTKTKVQKASAKLRSKLALLDARLLEGEFDENHYRCLEQHFKSWAWHVNEHLKGIRRKEQANDRNSSDAAKV